MFCRGRYKNSVDWLIDWLTSLGYCFKSCCTTHVYNSDDAPPHNCTRISCSNNHGFTHTIECIYGRKIRYLLHCYIEVEHSVTSWRFKSTAVLEFSYAQMHKLIRSASANIFLHSLADAPKLMLKSSLSQRTTSFPRRNYTHCAIFFSYWSVYCIIQLFI